MIVDIGGPGNAVLSGGSNLGGYRNEFPELGQDHNLLFLEEPWVTERLPQECSSALTEFYVALRGDPAEAPRKGASLRDECQLSSTAPSWGFDPNSYSKLVGAILSREQLRVTGFIGHSWGSVRLTYLKPEVVGPSLDLAWAVLVRPFPVGVNAAQLVNSQSSVIAGRTKDVSANGASEVEGRSLPVTYFDYLSAEISRGYLDDNSFADSVADMEKYPDQSSLKTIGRLSDAYWKRYGRTSISPGYLALVQETCAVLGGWTEPFGEIASPRDVLAASFLPCAERQPITGSVRPGNVQTCLVSSPLDSVVPEKLIKRAYGGTASTNLAWRTSTQRSHWSVDQLKECLAEVLEET
ncbi:hypothetical protein [Micromonospora sp. NPDC007230]|uniref:hypothetical protein n=1 Tax=Micromonospora sp. NPDC007230 TaxID=3364237 RepID=UPI0036A36718